MEYDCNRHIDSYISVTVEADTPEQAEELARPLLEELADKEFTRQVVANAEVDSEISISKEVKVKKYLVDFASTSAEVEAEDEDEALRLARELYYNGELSCEISGVKELEEAG